MSKPLITLDLVDFEELRDAFNVLPKNLAARTMGAAAKRALQPALGALRNTTPKGPTGNLRRSIATASRRYIKTGTGAAVVGYRKPDSGSKPPEGSRRKANDKSRHQFIVEYGTAVRRTKKGANRGRSPARQPVIRAWRAVEGQVAANLLREMRAGIDLAMKQLLDPKGRKVYGG